MKKLLILIFSILISFNSYGDWKFVTSSDNGSKFFIDTDTIKVHNENVFFWRLGDDIKPDFSGNLSYAMYLEGDCRIFRERTLSFVFYAGSMGKGDGEQSSPIGKNGDWRYPAPNNTNLITLKFVCDYVQ